MTRGHAGGASRSDFTGAGHLLMVVDHKGLATHFVEPGGVVMHPERINEMLQELGVRVRVDKEGRPTIPTEPPVSQPDKEEACYK